MLINQYKSNISLPDILDDGNKLIGPNFLDWYHNVRTILKLERMTQVLQKSIPLIMRTLVKKVCDNYQHHIDDDEQGARLMLANMTSILEKQHENMDVHIIIIHLKELFK